MGDFDFTDCARETALGDRVAWLERELKRALSQRRMMFIKGFESALEMAEAGSTVAEMRDFFEELT